jgi:hypothetical protein
MPVLLPNEPTQSTNPLEAAGSRVEKKKVCGTCGGESVKNREVCVSKSRRWKAHWIHSFSVMRFLR